MVDLQLSSVQDLVDELKSRNLSFLIVFADHQQFDKRNPDQAVVWGCDGGGNLVLQDTLLRLLTEWHGQVVKQRCQPGSGEA